MLKIALAGNPNTGKSSLFNALTGLKQKVANYPGITVEKSIGYFTLPDGRKAELVDLPGTYSLFPKSLDEAIPYEVLINKEHPQHPDLVLYIADSSNLKRNLVFFSQIVDLGLPVVLVLNMVDQAKAKGLHLDTEAISKQLGVPVVGINARKQKGIDDLKAQLLKKVKPSHLSFYTEEHPAYKQNYSYIQLLQRHHKAVRNLHLRRHNSSGTDTLVAEEPFDTGKNGREDLLHRHRKISKLLENFDAPPIQTPFRKRQEWLDKILIHKVWGYFIFFAILFLVFQAIFSWAELPMNWIEAGMAWAGDGISRVLGEGILSDLLVNGVVAGLNGVLVFIPQIAFLFFFISLMEDTGYLARVAFLMDRTMRRFGLNGKSVIPLISGTACAVPAILSARNIEHPHSRLITILVTPLMTCSARLPIYILLIGIVVPDRTLFGFFNLQGLALMAMYLIGFLSAIGGAWLVKTILDPKTKQYFILELPVYRMPNWRNVATNVYKKVGTFVTEAGKIIVAISIVLWFLASFGPGDKMQQVNQKYEQLIQQQPENTEALERAKGSAKLEASYAGHIGHLIEPAIRPLGYDWKIGIALITSFAAREVFVGTMATLYGLEGDESEFSALKENMRKDTNSVTGERIYTTGTVASLLLFYVFAMQCISTIAVTRKETGGWKWPAIQFGVLTGTAYLVSFIVYQLL